MLRSRLHDYNNVYIRVSETIIEGGGNNSIQVVFKNCAPFINCISEINNTQIDNAKYISIVMTLYNIIEYSNNYLKTSGILWQYYRDEPVLNNDGAPVNFPGNSTSFKIKEKIPSLIGADGTEAVKLMVPLKYLNNFWRTLEIPLTNCKIYLILTWSANCVIPNAAANQAKTFAIAEMFQL